MNRSNLDAIQRYLIIGVLFIAPLIFLTNAYEVFDGPKLTTVIVGSSLAAGWVALFTKAPEASRARAVAVPVACFVGPLVVAWLFTPYKTFALLGEYGRFTGLLPYMVFGLWAIVIAVSPVTREQVSLALAWSAFVVATYAIFQRFGLDPLEWTETWSGSTIGNPNFTGGFLAVCFPLGLSIAADRPRVLAFWYWWLLPLTVGMGSFMTQSRGALVALVVSGLVWLGLRLRTYKPVALVAAVMVGVGLIAYVLVLKAPEPLEPAPDSLEQRHMWWVGATEMFLDSPLVGRGPGAYAIEGVDHRSATEALAFPSTLPTDPHSVPYGLLAGAGILGGIGFLLFAGWCALYIARRPAGDLSAAGLAAALAAYLAQSLVSIDDVSIRVALWAVVGATALSSATAPQVKKSTRGKKRRQSPEPLLLSHPLRWTGAALCLAPLVWSLFLFGTDVAVGEMASGEKDPAEVLPVAANLPLTLEFDRIYAYYIASLAGTAQPVTEAELQHAFTYLEEYPELEGWQRLATALHALKDFEAAAQEWRVVVARDPFNPNARQGLARALIEMGAPLRAAETLDEISNEVGPDRYPEFWGLLALARAAAEQNEAAEEAIAIALALDPTQADALEAVESLEGSGS